MIKYQTLKSIFDAYLQMSDKVRYTNSNQHVNEPNSEHYYHNDPCDSDINYLQYHNFNNNDLYPNYDDLSFNKNQHQSINHIHKKLNIWFTQVLNQLKTWKFTAAQIYRFQFDFDIKIIRDEYNAYQRSYFEKYTDYINNKQPIVINYIDHIGLTIDQIKTLLSLIDPKWSYQMMTFNNNHKSELIAILWRKPINLATLNNIREYKNPETHYRFLGLYPVDYLDTCLEHQQDIISFVDPYIRDDHKNDVITQEYNNYHFDILNSSLNPLIAITTDNDGLEYQDFINQPRIKNFITQQG